MKLEQNSATNEAAETTDAIDGTATNAQQAWLTVNRVSYLRTLAKLKDKAVEVKMHEGVTLSGVYKAIDPDEGNMFVTNVELPMGGTTPAAVLRTSDIISAQFKGDF